MLRRFVRLFGGDPNKQKVERLYPLVDDINRLEAEYEALSDRALRAKTDEFRARLADELDGLEDEKERASITKKVLMDLLPEAFAAVREASKRTIGLRHYDVQLIGGIVLHSGQIAEMRTGEGKTLVATLPLYLNALTGRGVHLVTVNDYLARRDARWMAPIYNALGLSVGVLQMAARTENGKKAFLVDLERESPHEDQNQLRMVPRQESYAADITYGTNSEFGFDYLRDNMVMRLDERVQRGHYFSIVDEVDNVLIDEARTPLIISGPAQDEAEWYIKMSQVVRALRPEDYEINEKDRNVTLTELGEMHVEELLGTPLRDPDRPEDVTPEQARLIGYLEQGLRAQFLFRRNKDYLVQAGKVVIIDEFTGRLMPGRRWSDGLHQAVEAKEGVKVESESVTYATITIQNYFRMYDKLAGMTGTAATEAEEFDKIYKLDVTVIPTNLEYQAARANASLIEVEDRDEQGYKYRYYALRDDTQRKPVFWQRQDFPDVVYRTEEAKLRAIAQEILRYHVKGRPMLVGTTSVELSERVSSRLRAEPLRRLAQVLLLRAAWFARNNREEDGRQVPELQFLNTSLDRLDVSDMRRLARELEISFNPEDPANLESLLALLNLTAQDGERLAADLQAGIPHQVLNARKHTEESQIIAGAGAFGAVTIATNMAGRGVDIKLGGELAEEILAGVARVLRRAGYEHPFEMTMEERRQALQAMNPDEYGIYDTEVKFFLQYMEDMERVRALGGLHVIGSERHEARRIDNQLRGRAARQGDPGSSRFYLSMEDELMRLFGGQQADGLMQRMKIDDALPLEVGMVGRIVEQSQTRVEGANFDVRKHLLEYDDVLNTQRTKIYAQRNRIFTKDDLSDDVAEMLRNEVARHVPQALQDEQEGPWKLLAWLEQIQPTFTIDTFVYPSFMLSLIADDLLQGRPAIPDRQAARDMLIQVARTSIDAEEAHHLRTVNLLLNQTQDRLDSQLKERLEAVDTFFDGLSVDDETDTRRPAELLAELSNLAHVPIKLTPEQLRVLKEKADRRHSIDHVIDDVREQVEAALTAQAVARLVGSIERRLDESLELSPNQLTGHDWGTIAEQVLAAIKSVFARRVERYIGSGMQTDGQISKDLENVLERITGPVSRAQLLQMLLILPQGARASFDRRTHRRVWQRTNRLTYVYAAARYLERRDEEEIVDQVLEHLEQAQAATRHAWGLAEWGRLASARILDLDERSRNGLRQALGDDIYRLVESQPLQTLTGDEREQVIDELGRQALTEIYRQLLLSVITDLWIDYLTQMEALRVSIGLEAYAQRDPLVQYKSRAFAMFQELLVNIGQGVVTRMFTYRPRTLTNVQAAPARSQAQVAPDGDGGSPPPEEEFVSEEEAVESVEETAARLAEAGERLETADRQEARDLRSESEEPGSKKRRRRRH